jgi:excisionase family DNA binding protein
MTKDLKAPEATTQGKLLDGYLTTAQLAKQLRVRPETISGWIAGVDGLPYLRLGRCNYFKIDDVKAWLQRRHHVQARQSPTPARG